MDMRCSRCRTRKLDNGWRQLVEGDMENIGNVANELGQFLMVGDVICRECDRKYFNGRTILETMGPWCDEAKQFVETIGRLMRASTGEKRSKQFLIQRISLAIQRGNAACVMGTVPNTSALDEIFRLI